MSVVGAEYEVLDAETGTPDGMWLLASRREVLPSGIERFRVVDPNEFRAIVRFLSADSRSAAELRRLFLSGSATTATSLEDALLQAWSAGSVSAYDVEYATRVASPAEARSMADRIGRVLEFALQSLDDAAAEQLRSLLPTLVIVLTLWAVAHAAGVGFAVDVLLLASGFVFLGVAIWGVAERLVEVLATIANPSATEEQLRAAGRALADVIVTIGIIAFTRMINRAARSAQRPHAHASTLRGAQDRTISLVRIRIDPDGTPVYGLSTAANSSSAIVRSSGTQVTRGAPLNLNPLFGRGVNLQPTAAGGIVPIGGVGHSGAIAPTEFIGPLRTGETARVAALTQAAQAREVAERARVARNRQISDAIRSEAIPSTLDVAVTPYATWNEAGAAASRFNARPPAAELVAVRIPFLRRVRVPSVRDGRSETVEVASVAVIVGDPVGISSQVAAYKADGRMAPSFDIGGSAQQVGVSNWGPRLTAAANGRAINIERTTPTGLHGVHVLVRTTLAQATREALAHNAGSNTTVKIALELRVTVTGLANYSVQGLAPVTYEHYPLEILSFLQTVQARLVAPSDVIIRDSSPTRDWWTTILQHQLNWKALVDESRAPATFRGSSVGTYPSGGEAIRWALGFNGRSRPSTNDLVAVYLPLFRRMSDGSAEIGRGRVETVFVGPPQTVIDFIAEMRTQGRLPPDQDYPLAKVLADAGLQQSWPARLQADQPAPAVEAPSATPLMIAPSEPSASTASSAPPPNPPPSRSSVGGDRPLTPADFPPSVNTQLRSFHALLSQADPTVPASFETWLRALRDPSAVPRYVRQPVFDALAARGVFDGERPTVTARDYATARNYGARSSNSFEDAFSIVGRLLDDLAVLPPRSGTPQALVSTFDASEWSVVGYAFVAPPPLVLFPRTLGIEGVQTKLRAVVEALDPPLRPSWNERLTADFVRTELGHPSNPGWNPATETINTPASLAWLRTVSDPTPAQMLVRRMLALEATLVTSLTELRQAAVAQLVADDMFLLEPSIMPEVIQHGAVAGGYAIPVAAEFDARGIRRLTRIHLYPRSSGSESLNVETPHTHGKFHAQGIIVTAGPGGGFINTIPNVNQSTTSTPWTLQRPSYSGSAGSALSNTGIHVDWQGRPVSREFRGEGEVYSLEAGDPHIASANDSINFFTFLRAEVPGDQYVVERDTGSSTPTTRDRRQGVEEVGVRRGILEQIQRRIAEAAQRSRQPQRKP